MRGGARRANLESTSRAKRSKQLSYELLHVRQADVRARLLDGLVAFDDGLSLDQVGAGDARHRGLCVESRRLRGDVEAMAWTVDAMIQHEDPVKIPHCPEPPATNHQKKF